MSKAKKIADESPEAIFGLRLPRNPFRPVRELLVRPEISTSGNIVCRVGRTVLDLSNNEKSWERHGHVVMSLDEAEEYHEALGKAIAEATAQRQEQER